MSNPADGFGAATPQEPIVFGARRPGYPSHRVPQAEVDDWIAFMQRQGIQRVVCHLPDSQLAYYDHLLESYRQAFGADRVCWAPIRDFHLADVRTLTETILPFLAQAERCNEKTVVHCSGGIGRTGHVLAAWLVSFRGMSNQAAIDAVRRTGRDAQESGDPGLGALLDTCRNKFAYPKTP
jgi:protein-tyrosine phosphatase